MAKIVLRLPSDVVIPALTRPSAAVALAGDSLDDGVLRTALRTRLLGQAVR